MPTWCVFARVRVNVCVYGVGFGTQNLCSAHILLLSVCAIPTRCVCVYVCACACVCVCANPRPVLNTHSTVECTQLLCFYLGKLFFLKKDLFTLLYVYECLVSCMAVYHVFTEGVTDPLKPENHYVGAGS